MPNKKLSEEKNQPRITTLLPNCPIESECKSVKGGPNVNHKLIEDLTTHEGIEFTEVTSAKKRKRRNRSSGSGSKTNPNKKIQYGKS